MAKLKDKIRSKKLSVPKRWRVLVITILFLMIPVLTYFTLFISNQASYITNQNFRQLASISNQVEQRIANLNTAFSHAVANTVGNQFVANTEGNQFKAQQASSGLYLFQQSLEDSRARPDDSDARFVAIGADPVPKYRNRDELDRDLSSRQIEMGVIHEGETSWLVFVCEMQHYLPKSKPEPLRFMAKIKLDDIISPLVRKREIESIRGSEHEEGFDDILIFSLEDNSKNAPPQETSETGVISKVIFQQETPELDIASLDKLPRADTPDKTIDFRMLSRSTSSADVLLADTNYKIYLQPLEIHIPKVKPSSQEIQRVVPSDQVIPNDQEGSRWVVCGLVQASHFRHETWAFSYTLLISLAFVTALVALSWPFLKLLFIGTKDRLRLADVYFIAFALFIGSALLTLFMLFGLTYLRSERELDGQLKKLSEEIVDHFSAEVHSAAQEVDQLNRNANAGKPNPRANILEDIKNDPYPYFITAVWVDRKGEWQNQWTVKPRPSSYPPRVGDRDYFKKIMEGNFRELGEERFWLEPIESRLTGAKKVIISKPLYSEAPTDAHIKGITAIDLSLMSLMQTVVPSGFGYRVIDNSGHDPGDDGVDVPGKVLFQSSETQQLSENFFEECDNNHSLRSLVFGRGSDFVNVDYRGEGHRLYVSPIKGFPNWSLVVFRNKQPLRTVYLEILTLAGFIFLIYAVTLLIFFTVIYLVKINTRNQTEWIWPSEEMSGIYYQSFFFNLILFLLSAIVILKWDGRGAVLWVSLIAFAGIVSLALRLKLGLPFNRLNRAVEFFRINKLFDKDSAYIWNMFALLVLMGILPAVAFFKVAYNEEMKLFVKHEQITIFQGLEEREARIRSQYSTERADLVNNPPPIKNRDDAENFIKRRLDNPLDVYDDFFFGTTHSIVNEAPAQQKKETTDSLLIFFNALVPFFNQTSVEMGGLTRNQAADVAWKWEEQSGELSLHIPKVQRTEALHITTPLQRFGAPPLFLFFWAMGFLTIFVSLFYLTRFVVRKVFLLDVDETLYISRLPEDRSSIAQNHFIVQGSPLAHQDGLLQADRFYRIDLTTESQGKGWVEKIESRIKNEACPERVFVDHFEYQINSPSINDQKLRLIEGLLAVSKIVVIKSSAEPAAYSFGKAANKGENEFKTQSNGSGDRWAEIIGRFRKVYFVENDDAEFKEALSNLQSSLDDPAIPEQRRRRILKLAQSVQEECAPRAVLQNIGKEIIKQPGFKKEIIKQPGFKEMEPDHILDQIFNRAELYYQKIWDNCSTGEKLTLLHLAEDRLLSPNDPDIKSLLRKGLIERAPNIKLMNETFQRFVLSQSLSGGLELIETQAKKASPWEALKVPLLIVFVGVLLFLILTQKDFYSSSLTIITAVTTGIPAVFKLLSLFQGESASQSARV